MLILGIIFVVIVPKIYILGSQNVELHMMRMISEKVLYCI